MATQWSISKRLGISLVFIFLLGFIYLARALLVPLVVAGVLAYVLYPAVHFLSHHLKLPHRLAVWIVYIQVLAFLIIAPILLAPLIVEQVTTISVDRADIEARLGISFDRDLSFLFFEIPLDELLTTLETNTSVLLQSDRVFRVLRSGTTNLAWVLIILVATYYLLLDWHQLRDWLIGLSPPAHEAEIRALYRQIAQIWQAYLRGQLLLMLTIGILTSLASLALGLRGALALGLMAGVLDAVPSVGPAVAMAVATGVAWFEGSTYLPLSEGVFAILTLSAYGLIQLLENIYFRPRIMKYALQLHPAVVIVAIIGSLTLAGVLVTLIIIPLISSLMVIGRYVHARIMPNPPLVSSPKPIVQETTP